MGYVLRGYAVIILTLWGGTFRLSPRRLNHLREELPHTCLRLRIDLALGTHPLSWRPGRDDGLLELHRLCALPGALALWARRGDDGDGVTMGWPNGWRNLPHRPLPPAVRS